MGGQRASISFADNATPVGAELRFDSRGDDGGSVFGTENDMRQKIGEGIGHRDLNFRG
jgi:hypothetical protein